jgi:EmrB/QacA subfamily drug resistance transporter
MPEERAGDSRKWLTLVAMTGALSMILIDATVVSVALPTIQRDLDLSTTSLQWVVNAYLLTLAGFVAVGGRLSDDLGRVRLFIVGVSVFALASAGAGLSHFVDSSELLIACRAVQGIGGALMVPSSQAIVTNAFPISERGTAMGIYAGISIGFLALGPLIGGLLTEHIGWEWVFFVNLPVAVGTLVLTAVAKPDGTPVPRGGRFDWAGAVLIVVGLGATVYALQQSGADGWSDPLILGLLAGGLALLAAFVVIELREANPLIDLSIFKYGNFAADSLVLFMVQFALMGMSVFGAIYAQDLLGFSPVIAGLALFPLTVPLLVVAPPAGRLYDRMGPRLLVSLGALLTGAGVAWSAAWLLDFDYWWLVPGYVVVGVGVALIMTPANTDGMNTAPADLRGQASGVIQTVRQVGGTVGIAIMTTVIVSVTNTSLSDKLAAQGLSSAQVAEIESGLSQGQTGGTGSSSELSSLPAQTQQELESIVETSYATGIRAGYLVVAALMVLSGVVAPWRLRKVDFAEDEGVDPHPLADHAHPRDGGLAVG